MWASLKEFFQSIPHLFAVISQFPPWFHYFFILTLLLLFITTGFFIYYYTVTQTANELTSQENSALSGDAQAMLKLALAGSSRAYEILASVLESNNTEEIRKSAVNAISKLNDNRKISLLGTIMITESSGVAAECALALGRSRDASAIPHLVLALQSNNFPVANRAAEALGFFKPTEPSSRALVSALSGGGFVAKSAKQTLIVHGDASVPFLIKTLERDKSWTPEELLFTIEALNAIGNKAALEPLQQVRDKVEEMENWPNNVKDRLYSAIAQTLATLQ
jgi:HEAT repeat protein